jgi:hypothetical protein
MAGVDLKIVQELMGNKTTVAFTAGYAYLASTYELKAFETLARPRRLPVRSGTIFVSKRKNGPQNQAIKYTSSY